MNRKFKEIVNAYYGYGESAYIDTDVMIYNRFKKQSNLSTIEKIIFNDPATIVFWKDGTKTVVKCGEDDIFDPEKGLAMAISKKALGNKGYYYDAFKKWLPEEDE